MSTAKDVDVLIERANARGLSLRTVADVLGIHPHLLRTHLLRPGGSLNGLSGQPVNVLIELARLIQAHPADIVAGLDSVLDFPRLAGDPGEGEQAAPEAGRDALTVLAALAAAGNPASIDQLAEALAWPPERVADAVDHAELNPDVGGALALHRTDTIHYTAAPVLNLLTADQREALKALGPKLPLLSTDELDVLSALIDNYPVPHDIPHDGDEARQRLLNRGLLRPGPGGPTIDADVLYGLGAYHKPHMIIMAGDPVPFAGLPPEPSPWAEFDREITDQDIEEMRAHAQARQAELKVLFRDVLGIDLPDPRTTDTA